MGVGVTVGLWLGVAVIFVVILWPRLQDGDFYEVGDPLVYLGLPVLAMTTVAGSIVGLAVGLRQRRRLQPEARWATQIAGVIGVAFLVALYGWGVG